jgi:hypothetical protein
MFLGLLCATAVTAVFFLRDLSEPSVLSAVKSGVRNARSRERR